MSENEFAIIAKEILAVYGDKVRLNNADVVEIWYEMLKDLDYSFASKAVKRYIMTNNNPPTIADIRKQYRKLKGPKQMDEAEAWGLVKKALRNSAYNEISEYEALPSIIKKAVGSAEALHEMAINENFNENVERSYFIKRYRFVCEQEEDYYYEE